MSSRYRLTNHPYIHKEVSEARRLFKITYSGAGAGILEKLELRISRRPDSADLLGYTTESEEFRRFNEVFQIGGALIMCSVVVKIDCDYKSAEWLIFRFYPFQPPSLQVL